MACRVDVASACRPGDLALFCVSLVRASVICSSLSVSYYRGSSLDLGHLSRCHFRNETYDKFITYRRYERRGCRSAPFFRLHCLTNSFLRLRCPMHHGRTLVLWGLRRVRSSLLRPLPRRSSGNLSSAGGTVRRARLSTRG